MDIQFYLLEEETHITSFYEMQSNPFNVGDKIYLSVSELRLNQTGTFKDSIKQQFKEKNIELADKFNLKEMELLTEKKFVKFNCLGEQKLTIEYHCILSK